MPVASVKPSQTPLSTPKSNKMKKTPKTGDKASKKVAGTPQVSKENQTPSNVKTPVSKKSAKKESKKDGLVLKHDSQLPDKPVLAKFVSALMQVDRKVSEKDGKQLFDEDGIPLALQITGIKLPRDDRKQMIKVRLPHCVIQPPRDVCLITKDLKKGLKEDHEDSVNHFKDLMEEKGVSNDLVSEVISLRQLKVEYKQYESKLSLVKRYDIFLADTRIMRLIPKFLGKPFYARKKFPVPINLRADNLKQEVQKGIDTVILPLSHHGTTSRVVFGNSKMSESDLTENLMALVEAVGARYPGGVKNIRSLHIKTDVSPAIPIHVNTASGNDLGFVDADIPNKVSRETVTGELSTQPGMEVTITPHGTIKVKKTGDPLWDDEKDEPFVSGSEEEGEEEEDKDAKAKKEQPKKRKVDAAPADKKKAKKAKKDSDSDSEEEDIKESEKAYIKRAQKDDEQEEKLSKKQKKEAKKAKSEPVKEVEQTPSKKSKKEEKVANKQKDEKVADTKKQKDSKKTDKPVKKPVEQSEPETPKAKGKQATKEPKKSPKEEESDDEWTDASDSDENEASGDENEGSGDEVSELEFTDGSDDDDEDDDDSDDEGDESRITEVYDDQQELDAKDVIVDSDDDSDAGDASDDRIMLDPKLRGQAEAASDSGEEEETPKKGKKLTKNQKRKQRQEEKSSSKPQQKQKKSSKQQSPAVQNKKPAKQQSPAQNKKPAGKKPVPVKPASSKGKPGKKR